MVDLVPEEYDVFTDREYKLFAYQGPAIVAGPCFIPGSSALTSATVETDRGGCVLVVEGRGGAAGVYRRMRRLSRLHQGTNAGRATDSPTGKTLAVNLSALCLLAIEIRRPGDGPPTIVAKEHRACG